MFLSQRCVDWQEIRNKLLDWRILRWSYDSKLTTASNRMMLPGYIHAFDDQSDSQIFLYMCRIRTAWRQCERTSVSPSSDDTKIDGRNIHMQMVSFSHGFSCVPICAWNSDRIVCIRGIRSHGERRCVPAIHLTYWTYHRRMNTFAFLHYSGFSCFHLVLHHFGERIDCVAIVRYAKRIFCHIFCIRTRFGGLRYDVYSSRRRWRKKDDNADICERDFWLDLKHWTMESET